jgi:flagellar motor switch protein FliG
MQQIAEAPKAGQHSPMLQLNPPQPEACATQHGLAISQQAAAPLAAEKFARHLSGLRKAAVLLITLGEEASSSIVKDLTDEEVHTISKSIMTSQPVTSEEAFAVLREFNELATARNYVVKGGSDYASKLLRKAFGADAARRVVDRVNQSIGAESANFDSLQNSEPQQLANFIHSEHPQTIALILSHLPPSQSARLLEALPEGMRPNVAKRMANLEQISPEIIAKIAQTVGDRLKSLGDISRQSYGGVRAVAEMFNHLDAGHRKNILNSIGETDPGLVGNIRHLMFVFEDLLGVDAAGMRELVSAVDRRMLTVALKGVSEKLQQHVLQHLSTEGALMLREDIDALGPVRIKDVEAAQQEVIATLRKLEAEGVLALANGSNDRYVA